jgi:hypothetical protein
MSFQKATKTQAKLRFTFDGVAGSGKTYSSLMLARELVGPAGRVGLIDTEHGSASKYADKFAFDTLILDNFSIDTYSAALADAAKAGFDALIIDSLSHAWMGKGGALEEVDRVTARSQSKNAFTSGWRDVTPKHNAFVDAMLSYPGHLICTMRKKSDWIIEEVNGKKTPRKIGLAPVQRDGMEYEFDVIADLDTDGIITIAKTRCDTLTPLRDQLKHADVPRLAALLRTWLTDGAAAPPPPPFQPKPAAPAAPAESGVDRAAIASRIRAVASLPELAKLALELAKVPPVDKDALRGVFNQRQTELKQAAGKAA